MSHIHSSPGQHDLTVGVYIVRLDAKLPTLVLHRHKILGKLLQFGGHVELTETPWQAVIRKINDESGYHMDQLMVLQPKRRLLYLGDEVTIHPQPVVIHTHRYSDLQHYHTDIAFGFVTYEGPHMLSKEGVVTEYSYVTSAQLADTSTEDMYEHVRNTGMYVIDECVPNWARVNPNQFMG